MALADDIVTVNEPVYLESVVSASPMWHNQVPHYVHPEMSTVWRRLAEGLIEATAPTYDRIFVSGPRAGSDASVATRLMSSDSSRHTASR